MNASAVSVRDRWLARGALGAVAAAVILLVVAPSVRGVVLVGLIAAQVVVTVVAAWLFLAYRGALRIAGGLLAVAATLAAVGLEAANGLLWVVLGCLALLVLAAVAARAALRPAPMAAPSAEDLAPPVHQPFLIMNPRSGGGKVGRFHLVEEAERLGAKVSLLDGPGPVDVGELARKAVADGADLLGVAGGDGTQAIVAGVAAENDLPLLVIPAGTRNHFAIDLGLDVEDPATSLRALTDGVEQRVDLGDVDGRPFVNNVSFGAYADIVARPDYRDDKVRVTLDVLPDVLSQHQGPELKVDTGDAVIQGPTAALISNNPYGTGDIAGLSRRSRLDGGVLGLVAVQVTSARQAVGLLRGLRTRGATVRTARHILVDSGEPTIPAGIDGETVLLPTPVHCDVRPHALRVRLPRQRPGVPPVGEPVTVQRLLLVARGRQPADAANRS